MFSNTLGSNNAAFGAFALATNTTGGDNTATGVGALIADTTGGGNTAHGAGALPSNVDGIRNTAMGWLTLQDNTSGSDNIAIGVQAGSAFTTESQNIDIANDGVAGDSGTIRIGRFLQTKTFIAGIRGVTTVMNNAIPVVIDSVGQLGTQSSSRRFKREIKPMDDASEAILALKSVSFHYKNDKTNRPEFGLIAEDVAEVNRDLVVRDENGDIYTVRYDAVNAMLLNEFLKEHNAFVEEQRKVEQQQKEIDALKTELKEQRALIEKVNDKMELKASASQTTANNQ